MDLYEALKEGATEEELLTAFKKELAEAAAQLNAEEEAERQEDLEDARWDLADALLVYMDILFNDGSLDDVTNIDVYNALCDLEDMNYLESLCGVLVSMDPSEEEEDPSAAEEKSKSCSVADEDKDWKIIEDLIDRIFK